MAGRFTKNELRVVQRYNTPEKVKRLIGSFGYNNIDFPIKSFRQVLRSGNANCLESSLTAATILEYHGFAPLIIDLVSTGNDDDHVIYLYEKNNLYGAITKSKFPGIGGKSATFPTVEDLVWSYSVSYHKDNSRLYKYAVIDLNDIKRVDWRFSRKCIYPIENHLGKFKHNILTSSKRKILSQRKSKNGFH